MRVTNLVLEKKDPPTFHRPSSYWAPNFWHFCSTYVASKVSENVGYSAPCKVLVGAFL